jgi:hypothetical protein
VNKIAVKDLIRKYLMKKYRKEIALGLGGSALVGGAIGYGLGKVRVRELHR